MASLGDNTVRAFRFIDSFPAIQDLSVLSLVIEDAEENLPHLHLPDLRRFFSPDFHLGFYRSLLHSSPPLVQLTTEIGFFRHIPAGYLQVEELTIY